MGEAKRRKAAGSTRGESAFTGTPEEWAAMMEKRNWQMSEDEMPDVFYYLTRGFKSAVEEMYGGDIDAALTKELIAAGRPVEGKEADTLRVFARSQVAAMVNEAVSQSVKYPPIMQLLWWRWFSENDPFMRAWLDRNDAERESLKATKH